MKSPVSDAAPGVAGLKALSRLTRRGDDMDCCGPIAGCHRLAGFDPTWAWELLPVLNTVVTPCSCYVVRNSHIAPTTPTGVAQLTFLICGQLLLVNKVWSPQSLRWLKAGYLLCCTAGSAIGG